MAKSSNYRVQLRRRREGKTDYQARKALVISGRPRLVTRTSIRNVNAQIIIAKQTGDRVLAAANSRELAKKYGWKAPTGNIPAAYLTGLLVGLKAKKAGVDAAILDIGLITPTKGARIFAVLKGVVDACIEIPHSEEKLAKDRLKGDHIALYAKDLSADSEEYNLKFSKYGAGGVSPEKVTEHFSHVRSEIVNAFKGAKVAPEPEGAPEPKAKSSKPDTKSILPSKTVTKVRVEPKAAAKVEAAPVHKAETQTEVKLIKEEVATKEASKSKEKVISKEKAATKVQTVKETPKEKGEKQLKAKLTSKEKTSPSKVVPNVKVTKKEETPKQKPTKKGVKKA